MNIEKVRSMNSHVMNTADGKTDVFLNIDSFSEASSWSYQWHLIQPSKLSVNQSIFAYIITSSIPISVQTLFRYQFNIMGFFLSFFTITLIFGSSDSCLVTRKLNGNHKALSINQTPSECGCYDYKALTLAKIKSLDSDLAKELSSGTFSPPVFEYDNCTYIYASCDVNKTGVTKTLIRTNWPNGDMVYVSLAQNRWACPSRYIHRVLGRPLMSRTFLVPLRSSPFAVSQINQQRAALLNALLQRQMRSEESRMEVHRCWRRTAHCHWTTHLSFDLRINLWIWLLYCSYECNGKGENSKERFSRLIAPSWSSWCLALTPTCRLQDSSPKSLPRCVAVASRLPCCFHLIASPWSFPFPPICKQPNFHPNSPLIIILHFDMGACTAI